MDFLTVHLRDANESYLLHAKNALFFCISCFCASIALLIHALLPFLFVTAGSDMTAKLHKIMSLRRKTVYLSNSKIKKIAIIGFGASGILTLHNIVTNAKLDQNIEIDIFDKQAFGGSVAYNTKNIHHLLNVRAGNMSGLYDDKEHFTKWLKNNGYCYSANDFVPRSIYGLYLDDIATKAFQMATQKGIVCNFHCVNIDKILSKNNYFIVNNDLFHFCVLCIGIGMKNNQNNFWNVNLDDFFHDDEIHVIGTGLTALDAVISINNTGYKGKIFLHSRSGLLPQVHSDVVPLQVPVLNIVDASLPLQDIFRKFVSACKSAPDWRCAFDSIRAIEPELWQQFSIEKRQQFMRHCFRLWNVHRHRCPPEQYEKILDMLKSKLIITTKKNSSNKFIDCTGLELSTEHFELIGPFKRDDIGRGLVSTCSGFIIIGGLNFGTLFETIAVPELRIQAYKAAMQLLG